jgi:hypothetical protein
MTKPEIYSTIQLMVGAKCEIIIPNGGSYSRAMNKFNKQNEYDLMLFLIQACCLIDGNAQTVEYYSELNCDDYMKIMAVMINVITPIQ